MENNNKFNTLPKPVVTGFFILGLLSALAFRTLMIFYRLKPEWVTFVWYFGVLGYVAFFLYRFLIARKRKRMVTEYGLIDKLKQSRTLTEEENKAVIYLLSSIDKSKENWNYANIFILSTIAIILDIIMSILGKTS